MSTIELNGKQVSSGAITTPRWGAWVSDLMLPAGTVVAAGDPVELALSDLELEGTVIRSGEFAGATTVRAIGGKAGWRKTLAPRGYSHAAGVKLSTVLADAARESGESIVVATDRTLGTHYARREGKAERVLRRLLDSKWWIAPDGTTRTATREAGAITTPFTVVSRSASMGQVEIASEKLAPWQPGRTFSSSTVPEQEISSVTVTADNTGKLRLVVLTGEGERLRGDFGELVRAELDAVTFAGVHEYVVVADALGLLDTVDCKPTDRRMPALTRVPIVGLGKVSAPIAGTRCRIRFVDSDPARPECIALLDSTEHLLTVEAFTVIMHNIILGMGALALPSGWLASGITPGIINAALAAAGLPASPGTVAQLAAAPAIATAMASGPGNSSTLYAAAIALALAGKIRNSSALFPSVGVPNG